MLSAAAIPFWKMNGLGNEIVVIDLRQSDRVLQPGEVRAIAAWPRARFDQLMVLHKPRTGIDPQTGRAAPVVEAFIRIYNSDGSKAGACGNGMRCVGLMVAEATGRSKLRFATEAGVLAVTVASPAEITVRMGAPRFHWSEIPLAEPFNNTRQIELQIGPIDNPILHSPSVVNVGNPHAIFWVEDVDAVDLAKVGSLLENHPIFPERANISLAHVQSRSLIRLRTWERGAGLTRACGSAACAVAVAAARKGLTERDVTVLVPGGPLHIVWGDDDQILMTGPAEFEYQSSFDGPALVGSAD